MCFLTDIWILCFSFVLLDSCSLDIDFTFSENRIWFVSLKTQTQCLLKVSVVFNEFAESDDSQSVHWRSRQEVFEYPFSMLPWSKSVSFIEFWLHRSADFSFCFSNTFPTSPTNLVTLVGGSGDILTGLIELSSDKFELKLDQVCVVHVHKVARVTYIY